MNKVEKKEPPKVLIFESSDLKYGLMVDSVDTIFTCNEDDKSKLPEFLYGNKSGKLIQDVKEAVQIINKDENKTLLVLNLEALSSRVTKDKAA